ncbi:hypothetical protein [Sphingorhabdus sp. YGSMI21]|uniref:hypothetical protein n=1 Tax=Sphingorhabdus sp. YGSMI21 TaxID=2077182 RepID=UPI000C1F40F3|nr:hypothetical protein [Sphingorhabdus sp. YGSMI21]ATW03818.1 hypothetical protein CHN51_09940 [Sphingorhabdus sp. YGSMI21]
MRFVNIFNTVSVLLATVPMISISQDADAQTLRGPYAVEEGPPAPSDRFDTITRGVSTSIDISEKEAKASASIGGVLTADRDTGGSDQKQDAFFWKLGLDAPVGGTTDLLDPKLDVLDNQVSLTGSLTWKRFSSSLSDLTDPRFQAYVRAAIEACEEQKKKDCEAHRRVPASVFVQDHLPEVHRRLSSAIYDPFYAVSVKGSVGVKEFDYILPGAFTDEDDTKISYSLAIAGVIYPSDTVSAWKLEAEYGNAFEAAEEGIVCRTVVTDPAEDCKSAAPSGPTSKETLVVRAEYRRFFMLSDVNKGIGIAPTGSVDFLSGDFGLEFPIFYKVGSKSPVLPGIKLGYTKDASKPNNKDEDFTVAFFIKTSFNLN